MSSRSVHDREFALRSRFLWKLADLDLSENSLVDGTNFSWKPNPALRLLLQKCVISSVCPRSGICSSIEISLKTRWSSPTWWNQLQLKTGQICTSPLFRPWICYTYVFRANRIIASFFRLRSPDTASGLVTFSVCLAWAVIGHWGNALKTGFRNVDHTVAELDWVQPIRWQITQWKSSCIEYDVPGLEIDDQR